MAVGQIPQGNSEQQFSGHSTGYQGMNKDTCGVVELYRLMGRRNRCDESHSLSGVDDAEISGYLNTMEEINRKRKIWELLNGNYTKGKKRKKTSEAKKGTSVKKADKTTEKVESQAMRRSSRINFDALNILNDELNQDSGTGPIMGANSSTHRSEEKQDERFDFDDLF